MEEYLIWKPVRTQSVDLGYRTQYAGWVLSRLSCLKITSCAEFITNLTCGEALLEDC